MSCYAPLQKERGAYFLTVSLNAKFAGINDAIISIETILDEVKFKGHYTCNFYDDDRGMGYDVPCVEESLYFNAIRGGEVIAEKVQFKVESYNLYGGLNGIYGPYTTMYIDEYDYRYNYGPYDPTDPNNRDYILISFEGTDYRFKYSEMTIERTIL